MGNDLKFFLKFIGDGTSASLASDKLKSALNMDFREANALIEEWVKIKTGG